LSRQVGFQGVVSCAMNSALPVTGTAQFLTLVDPYVPDDFINQHWNQRPNRRPHRCLSAAQLWRVHLLAVLTPTHSFNQLVALLPEQRAWREFVGLSHRHRGPDVRMLSEFRARIGVTGFRAINDQLRLPFIERAAGWSHAVALIDATDLPASCGGFKKKKPKATPLIAPRWEVARSKLGKPAASLATRSTPCGCGGGNTLRR
jgi:hypothetical protein